MLAAVARAALAVGLAAAIFIYHGTLDLEGFDSWAGLVVIPVLALFLLTIAGFSIAGIVKHKAAPRRRWFYIATLGAAVYPFAHFFFALVVPTLG